MLGIISDKHNFSITLKLLRNGSLSIDELAKEMEMSKQKVQEHIEKLVNCGYVFERRRKRKKHYFVNHKTIKPLLEILNKHIGTHIENKRRS